VKLARRFPREADGQDLIEYALLATIIALGVTTERALQLGRPDGA
jgi:Flp pilus assembly pilin Flp